MSKSTSLMQYVNAGYMAFRMAFSTAHFGAPMHRPYRPDNPYTDRPYNRLWRRGWDEAQREFEGDAPLSNFRYNPFENNRHVKEFVRQAEQRERFKNRKKVVPGTLPAKPHNGQRKPVTTAQVYPSPGKPGSMRPPTLVRPDHRPKPAEAMSLLGPVNLNKLNSLNRKYRTVA